MWCAILLYGAICCIVMSRGIVIFQYNVQLLAFTCLRFKLISEYKNTIKNRPFTLETTPATSLVGRACYVTFITGYAAIYTEVYC